MATRGKRERALSANLVLPKRTKKIDNNPVSGAQMDDAINAVASSQSQASVVVGGGGDGDAIVDVSGPVVQQSTTVERLSMELGELRVVVRQQQAQIDRLLSLLGVQSGVASEVPRSATGGPSDQSAPPSNEEPFTVVARRPGRRGRSSQSTAVPVDASEPPAAGPVSLSGDFKRSVVSAVYQDFFDHDRRSRNVIVSGLVAVDGTDDRTRFAELVFNEFNRIPDIVRCRRLGQPDANRVQRLLVVLRDPTEAEYLVQHARRLRESARAEVRTSVFINADVTQAEAHAAYVRRCERRRRAEEMRATRTRAQQTRLSTAGTSAAASTSHASRDTAGPVPGTSSSSSSGAGLLERLLHVAATGGAAHGGPMSGAGVDGNSAAADADPAAPAVAAAAAAAGGGGGSDGVSSD